MAFPTNTTPPWKSYMATGNTADIVASTTVASAIGAKVDAINGQSLNQTLQSPTITNGLTLDAITVGGDAVITSSAKTGPSLDLTNTSTTSQAASISFPGSWVEGTDFSQDNGGDYYINKTGLSSTPFTLTSDGRQIPQWTCNTVNATSAFDYVGAPVQINGYYGTNASAPMAASTAGLEVVTNVYNTQALPKSLLGYETYSEFSAVYTFLQGFTQQNGVDCVHANEHYIGYDNHIVTPYATDATKRPDIVMGMSYLGYLFGEGSELVDSNGQGSFMSTMVTRPPSASEVSYFGAPAGASIKPWTALYFGGGYTGAVGITDGAESGAYKAATYCFLAGNGGSGIGGSVYLKTGGRSQFQYGAGLGDWTDAGLIIGNPIGTTSSTGGRQYGIYNPFCTQIGGQLPDQTGGVALYLAPPTTETSRNVSVSIGDADSSGATGWTLTHDTGKSGGTDLGFWSNVAQKNMLWLDTDKVGFYGVSPVTRQVVSALASAATQDEIITTVNTLITALDAVGIIEKGS